MSAEDTTRQVAALREEMRELVESGRLRISEVTRALLAALSKTGGEHSTVRLTRNARGDTQIEVFVSTRATEGVVTVDEAVAQAVEVYDRLRAVYPMSSEPNRA